MAKKHRKPHRYKRKKPIYKNRFFWLVSLALFLLFFVLYFLFLTDLFFIKKINISGQEETPKEELLFLVEKKSENKILFFPSKSIFLINSNEIKKDILEKFPRIARAQIQRKLPDGINILISERKIAAVFCLPDQTEECFALDEEGVAFEKRQENNDNFLPRIKIFQEKINLGENIIEKEELASVLEINSELEQVLKIPIKELAIESPDKLTALTKENWQLYFNLQEDIKWQLTKLKVLLEERISRENRQNLEYIELRFGNFANPKYKEIKIDPEIKSETINQNNI